MALATGIVFFAGFLVLQLAGRRKEWAPFNRSRPFLSMATAAFLMGFAAFMLLTPQVTSWVQKIAVSLIALVLAAVNILIPEGREKPSE